MPHGRRSDTSPKCQSSTPSLLPLQEILKASGAALGARQAEALSLLSRLRKAVQSHTLTESQILEALFRYPQVVSWLYDQVRRSCAGRRVAYYHAK